MWRLPESLPMAGAEARGSEQSQPPGAIGHDFCLPGGTLGGAEVRPIAGNPSDQVEEHGGRMFVRGNRRAKCDVSQVLEGVGKGVVLGVSPFPKSVSLGEFLR